MLASFIVSTAIAKPTAPPLDVAASAHPMTESVLNAVGGNPRLQRSAAARKWLEAIEDDQDIRKAFVDSQLQARLMAAGKLDASFHVNSLRLTPEARLRVLLLMVHAACAGGQISDAALSDDNVDAMFADYYHGLKAEVSGVPRATVSLERRDAAVSATMRVAVEYLAKEPEALDLFAQKQSSSASDAAKVCGFGKYLQPILAKLDPDSRDAVVIGMLAETPKFVPGGTRSHPFGDAQEFSRKHFSPVAVPAELQEQMRRHAKALSYNQVHTRLAIKTTTADSEQNLLVDESCKVVEGTFLRCVSEYSVKGATSPYATMFTLASPYPWMGKVQTILHDGPDQSAPEFSALASGSRLPGQIRPNSRFEFSTLRWTSDNAAAKKRLHVACASGGRYAASTIHPAIPGMAIDVVCNTAEGGIATQWQTFAFLEAFGAFTLRHWSTADTAGTASYLDISIKPPLLPPAPATAAGRQQGH
ncbi:hypothetical protein [Cupriavidus basilensis]|uniref:hypothetical protein n=1 Tax=Cupriavidus basilensis TaxID=68895 RepID=UPI0023E75596|nr:hypothetical protein [Cupriavidus basilensis]MDF3885994.1 hypothetical protein [Cupriavidus basilensis]